MQTENVKAMPETEPLIFDGHNDVLSKLYQEDGLRSKLFRDGNASAIDLPKARIGGFGGGFFAAWVPSPNESRTMFDKMTQSTYNLPLSDPIEQEVALKYVIQQTALLIELEAHKILQIVRTVSDIKQCFETGRLAAIFHLEGAEAIDADLKTLDTLNAVGLRSIGPVWSRPNIFGHGVPFRFPSTPDTGPGLTDLGKQLVRRCNALHIMLDVSHLNERGFWDVANLSNAPLVASHSNAHRLCPHSRNLTDDQLRAIAQSDGLVGLNFAVAFLRSDGKMIDDVPVTRLLTHLDYLIDILGEDHVALGSDYSGAMVPSELTTVANLPRLRDAMSNHGYQPERIKKLCHENWLRVLEKTWHNDS